MTSQIKHLCCLLPLAILASACDPIRIARTPYDISKFDDLIVSNSENNHRRMPVKSAPGEISFNYNLLISNRSSSHDYLLKADQARFALTKNYSVPAKCNDGQKMTLKPGKKTILECEITVASTSENNLTRKDVLGRIVIPYAAEGVTEPSQIEAIYQLRLEDFQ